MVGIRIPLELTKRALLAFQSSGMQFCSYLELKVLLALAPRFQLDHNHPGLSATGPYLRKPIKPIPPYKRLFLQLALFFRFFAWHIAWLFTRFPWAIFYEFPICVCKGLRTEKGEVGGGVVNRCKCFPVPVFTMDCGLRDLSREKKVVFVAIDFLRNSGPDPSDRSSHGDLRLSRGHSWRVTGRSYLDLAIICV